MQRASLLLAVLASAAASPATAQQLIPNGSFECHTDCPISGGDVVLAEPWFLVNAGGTSDYFHPCALATGYLAPTSATWGTQPAADGVAYVGGAFYKPSSGGICPNGIREYVQAPLNEPLVAGQSYTFSMKVSLADNCNRAIDTIGVHFSIGPLAPALHCALEIAPSLESAPGDYYDDKVDWMDFTGTYVASGGETHVSIGNFRGNDETGVITVPWSGPGFQPFTGAYYLIDDVSMLPQIGCAPPPAGMIAWWTLDEPFGPVAIDLEGPHDGTWIGAPDPSEGLVDTCYDFGASLGYVRVTSNPEIGIGLNDLSIDAWIQPAVIQNSPIVTKIEDADHPGVGYALYLTDTGTIGFAMEDEFGLLTVESIDTVCINEWYFVAVTVDRGEPDGGGRLYVNDAVTIFDLPATYGSLASAKPLFIGHQPITTAAVPWEGDFEGRIDEVELFNVSVPELSILTIYDAWTEGKCKPGPIVAPDITANPNVKPWITTVRFPRR